MLVLAASVVGDAVRRFVIGSEPVSGVVVAMSLGAAGINLWSLRLLGRLQLEDVNLRAARTFSVNDFMSNLGVLVAAALITWTGQVWPDLVVGLAIALVVGKGGLEILRDARNTGHAERGHS